MNYSHGRYAAQQTFKFIVTNINKGGESMSYNFFAIHKMPKEDPITQDYIRDTLQNNDNNMNVSTSARKIASYGRNIVGYLPYWWEQKEELASTIRQINFENYELPISFHIASTTEYYWKDLHRVLEKSLQSSGQLAEADTVLHVLNGGTSTELHDILNDNLQVVNDFLCFVQKHGLRYLLKEALVSPTIGIGLSFPKSEE